MMKSVCSYYMPTISILHEVFFLSFFSFFIGGHASMEISGRSHWGFILGFCFLGFFLHIAWCVVLLGQTRIINDVT